MIDLQHTFNRGMYVYDFVTLKKNFKASDIILWRTSQNIDPDVGVSGRIFYE